MNRSYVIVKTESQKDGEHFSIMEKSEAEKKVPEWNSFNGSSARIMQDVSLDVKHILKDASTESKSVSKNETQGELFSKVLSLPEEQQFDFESQLAYHLRQLLKSG